MRNEILRWVKIVVLKTMKEKRLTHLDSEILISAGLLGYSQSLRRFDKSRGVKFKTYAEHRIKGAVLDEVRKMIGDERCKKPKPQRVDFDFESIAEENDHLLNVEVISDIKNYLKCCGFAEQEFAVIEYRIQGMNLKEISKEMKISEGRVGQILSDIRLAMADWIYSYT